MTLKVVNNSDPGTADTVGGNDWDAMATLLNNRASGTATVANGATTAVVTHGLSITPSINDIKITPTNSMGSATKFFISTVTSTQFTINVNTDPGATTATFVWSIIPLS